MGVFLDKEGIFNNTCYDTMCDALVRHSSDYTIVQWIRATMEGCVTVATLNGFSMKLAISKGCPQGCVLSPLLWCLVVMTYWPGSVEMGYHSRICRWHMSSRGGGKFPNTVSGLMQWAILIVETWCNEVGLSVNPEKTGIVAFTTKRKLLGSFESQFFGVKLSLLGLVKYLGVILDSRLTWR